MSNRWADIDFLNQRGRPDRGAPSWQRIAAFAAGALVLALIAVWSSCGDDEESVDAQEVASQAVAEVDSAMDAAEEAVREQLEEQKEQRRREAQKREEALRANWEEGQPQSMLGELEQDQSVYVALTRREIPEGEIHRMVTAMEEEFDFRQSRAGDQWSAEITADGQIEEFRYEKSPEQIWVTTYDEDDQTYRTEKKDIELEVRQESLAGTVDGSFWLTMESAGQSGVLAHRFMRVFEYTIDFNTESRDGDHFAMIFEELYLDGEFLRHGRILGAKYIGQRGNRQAFLHQREDEDDGYYDENGESLQRQFLRSPLEVTRVTSGFGRREHPITGDERMHHGVDYGAPQGTPVQAVADGEVTFAGWRGGYGNLLIMRHSGGYETRYAHLSSFSVSVGQRVSQGDIVARSGNTGASTAPHLHYEMLRHGSHIDPLTVDATSGDPLEGQERREFVEKTVEPLSEQLRGVVARELPEAVAALDEVGEGDAED